MEKDAPNHAVPENIYRYTMGVVFGFHHPPGNLHPFTGWWVWIHSGTTQSVKCYPPPSPPPLQASTFNFCSGKNGFGVFFVFLFLYLHAFKFNNNL